MAIPDAEGQARAFGEQVRPGPGELALPLKAAAVEPKPRTVDPQPAGEVPMKPKRLE